MALTANRDVDHYVDQEVRSLRLAAGAHIYKGGFVGLSAGYARPLTAGDRCAGIAYEEMDNGGGAAGAKSVRLYTLGDFGHALSGAAVGNIGSAVYASSDNTLTFTVSGNSYVGLVLDVPATSEIILRLDTFKTAP